MLPLDSPPLHSLLLIIRGGWGGWGGGGGICSRSLSSNWIVSRIFRPSGDIKCIAGVSTSCQPWFQLTCKLFAHSRRVTFLESLCGLAALVWLCHLLHMTHSDSVIGCYVWMLSIDFILSAESLNNGTVTTAMWVPLYNYRIQEEKLTSVAHEVMTLNSSSEGLEFEPTYGNFPKIQNCIILQVRLRTITVHCTEFWRHKVSLGRPLNVFKRKI